MSIPPRRRDLLDVLVAVVLALLVAHFAIERWGWLAARPWPLDYTGFHHLQEVAHRLEHGRGYYVGFSPFFAALTAFTRAVSLPPADAFDLWIWLGLATFGAALVLLRPRAAPAWTIPGLMLLIWSSDAVFYFHYGFPRQAAAVTLLGFGLGALERSSLDSDDPRVWTGIALAWLAGFVHLFAAILGLVYVLARRPPRVRAVALTAPLAAIAVAGVARKLGEFGQIPVRPGPLEWDLARRRGWLSVSEYLEYPVHALFGALCVIVAWRLRSRSALLWIASVATLVFLLPVWDVGLLGRRLFLSVPAMVMLAAASLLGETAGASRATLRTASLYAFGAFVAVQASLGLLVPTGPRPLGPAMPVETLVRAAPLLRTWIPPDAHVRAPEGVQFRVTYFLDRSSSTSSGPDDPDVPRFALARDLDPAGRCIAVDRLREPGVDPSCVRLGGGWVVERLPARESGPPS